MPRLQSVLTQATLHQLKVFEAAARWCSFTRAAKELYLTQPTVSMQVKHLAEVVGLPLFEQVGKQLFLTEAGQELLAACYEVFEQFTQFETRIAALKGMKQGHLKIATISPINTFVSRLLSPFCHRYPGINISIDVMNSKQIGQCLSDNTHDLYLVCEPPADPDICSHPFVDNPLVVVAPSHHPLARQSVVSIAQLAGELFIMREQGSATRQAVQATLDEQGVSVRVQLEVGNNEAIKQMVMYGLGISVLSYHMVAAEAMNGQLAILNVSGLPINRSWYVAYPSGKQLSIVASTFLEFVHCAVNADSALAA